MCMWRACELLICAFVQSKCGLSSVNTCRYYFFFFWYTSNVSWYIHICVCVFLNVGKLFLGNCYHIHSSHVCSVLFCSLVASPYNILSVNLCVCGCRCCVLGAIQQLIEKALCSRHRGSLPPTKHVFPRSLQRVQCTILQDCLKRTNQMLNFTSIISAASFLKYLKTENQCLYFSASTLLKLTNLFCIYAKLLNFVALIEKRLCFRVRVFYLFFLHIRASPPPPSYTAWGYELVFFSIRLFVITRMRIPFVTCVFLQQGATDHR